MKLLTPAEIKDSKAQEAARQALRTKEILQAADNARKKLSSAEADFQMMLSGQQAQWAQEEKEHEKTVRERTEELEVLEERRQKALEPLQLLEQRAKNTLQDAQEAIRKAIQREEDADTLSELLQGKLDDIGAREQDVLRREQSVQAREENAHMQDSLIEQNTESVQRAFIELEREKKEAHGELNRLRTALTLQERSLDARAEKMEREKQNLDALAKRLSDERATLERAFARMKGTNIRTRKGAKVA